MKIPSKFYCLQYGTSRVMLRATSATDAIERLPLSYKKTLKNDMMKDFHIKRYSDKKFYEYLKNTIIEFEEERVKGIIERQKRWCNQCNSELKELETLLNPVGIVRPHFFEA